MTESIRRLLEDWVLKRFIPGGALRVLHRGKVRFVYDVGVANLLNQQPVTPQTIYDLASLTKVTTTLPAILLLLEENVLRLDDSLFSYFPECPEDKRGITINQLLMHTSGLPADLEDRRRDGTIRLPDIIYQIPLLHPPGTHVVYSDLGMIWLGLLVEKVTSMSFDQFVQDRVFTPLGMHSTCFNPDWQARDRVAATEYCSLKQEYIVAEVHDEKAYVMGGIAGHAGLFSTADDLVRYAAHWLYADPPLLGAECRRQASTCMTEGLGGHRGLGWESNYGDAHISCGSHFSKASFGHTGFTGTSIWIDPLQDIAVIFLTNAVHLGRGNPIRSLRPVLHDTIMTHLLESGE